MKALFFNHAERPQEQRGTHEGGFDSLYTLPTNRKYESHTNVARFLV